MTDRTKNILKNLLALFVGLALTGSMLVAAEGYLWLRARKAAHAAHARLDDNQSEFFIADPILGGKCKEGFKGPHHLRINDKEIFSTYYEFDDHSCRITPVDHADERTEGALFFGCSFCFGFGVAQDETLPACLAKECDALLPVNFANPGHGPQHMWLLIQQPDFLKQVPREKGVVLFGFIDHHIPRLMGDKDLVSTWGRRFPWLEITEEGVISRGFMEDREANNSSALKVLQRFHLGRFLVDRLKLVPAKFYTEEEGYHTLARLFTDVRKRLKAQLPDYELIVFAFPGALQGPQLGEVLKEYGIPFLDYSGLYRHFGEEVGDYFFADSLGTRWGHPKAPLYADVAKRLAEDLQEHCHRQGGSEQETEAE
ncbi:MAG TPA: hypothetical protein PLQ42_13010 [Candidatus Hydrogenedentes bacterium]|nr:hypothetical protein [Candidatus Hydrogenedentota bacterium]